MPTDVETGRISTSTATGRSNIVQAIGCIALSVCLCGCVSVEVIGKDGVSVNRTKGVFVEINAPEAYALNSKGVGGRVSRSSAFFGAFDEVVVLNSAGCRLVIFEADEAQAQNIISALQAAGIGGDSICKQSQQTGVVK
jgi:hypothetical protein